MNADQLVVFDTIGQKVVANLDGVGLILKDECRRIKDVHGLTHTWVNWDVQRGVADGHLILCQTALGFEMGFEKGQRRTGGVGIGIGPELGLGRAVSGGGWHLECTSG